MPETKKTPETKNTPDTKKTNNDSPNEKKAVSDNTNQKKEGNSLMFYILTVLTAFLLVILILGGAMFIAVKQNVNGIADTMRSDIEKIPVIKLALPKQPDPEDEKNMTEQMVRQKYTELRTQKKDLEQKISDLTKQIDDLNQKSTAKETNSTLLQQQKDKLTSDYAKLKTEYDSLKKDVDNMSDAIASGDKTEFKKYYEKIDPKKAEEIYTKIIQDQKISDEAKKFCAIFETMDASASAPVLEQMGTSKMSLIVEIMKNLKKETSADILSNMSTSFAAKVSEQLAKEYKLGSK